MTPKIVALLLGIPSIALMYSMYIYFIRGDGVIFATATSAVTALIIRVLSIKEPRLK